MARIMEMHQRGEGGGGQNGAKRTICVLFVRPAVPFRPVTGYSLPGPFRPLCSVFPPRPGASALSIASSSVVRCPDDDPSRRAPSALLHRRLTVTLLRVIPFAFGTVIGSSTPRDPPPNSRRPNARDAPNGAPTKSPNERIQCLYNSSNLLLIIHTLYIDKQEASTYVKYIQYFFEKKKKNLI